MNGFVDLREEVDRLVFELVDERRDAHEERDDVLSMLLEARHEDGSPMSDQELRDELMTLLVAGHETTASSLAWAFERLVRDPAVLGTPGLGDRLGRRRRLRDRDDPGDAAPSSGFADGRAALVKKPIEVGGWQYEPGACLVPSSYLLHHDPEVYPDPYAFRPERFLDSAPGTYTWIPFGGGRRRCLGAGVRAARDADRARQPSSRSYELRPGGERPELAERRNITITPGGGTRVCDRGPRSRRPSRRSPEPAA